MCVSLVSGCARPCLFGLFVIPCLPPMASPRKALRQAASKIKGSFVTSLLIIAQAGLPPRHFLHMSWASPQVLHLYLHTATSPGWPAKPRPAFPLHSFTASQAAPPVMCLTRARQEGPIPNCCATDSGITTQGDFARPTSTSKGDSFASSHRHFNNHHQHGHQGPSPQPVRCASRPGIEKVVPRARGLGHLP
jgi:hypothetical protein